MTYWEVTHPEKGTLVGTNVSHPKGQFPFKLVGTTVSFPGTGYQIIIGYSMVQSMEEIRRSPVEVGVVFIPLFTRF